MRILSSIAEYTSGGWGNILKVLVVAIIVLVIAWYICDSSNGTKKNRYGIIEERVSVLPLIGFLLTIFAVVSVSGICFSACIRQAGRDFHQTDIEIERMAQNTIAETIPAEFMEYVEFDDVMNIR